MPLVQKGDIVLVDQDGVLADFERHIITCYQERFPGQFFVPYEERKAFEVKFDYPEELHEDLRSVYCGAGFIADLPPIPGAIDGLRAMLAEGLDVRICTTPLNRFHNCVLEKYLWVERHLGDEFVSRMILTKDKTLVRGSVLIDDRPEIPGACVPEWKHLVFEAPYNAHVAGPHINWTTWRELLLG